MTGISIEVDTVVNAAYIRLSDNEVVRTVEFNEEILIDLDDMNVVVGIEVLDEGAALPFEELHTRYHVHNDVLELLQLIRPDVSSFLELSQGSEGSTQSRSVQRLEVIGG